MEVRTINILPTSIDSKRAFFTIPQGTKYLTNKIRLADFELLNGDQRPIYFGPKGFYSLIKSISFLNSTGNAIDSMTNTDYIALKMLQAPNGIQRDVSRVLYQNAGISIDCPTLGTIALNEQHGKQDATKIGGYIDLSYMSNYLQARQISTDQLQIQIEFIDSGLIQGGYAFSRPPSLFVDEVLSGEPVDNQDVIIFNTIVADRIPIYAKKTVAEVTTDHITNYESLEPVSLSQRMNSYNQQMISNLYVYLPESINGAVSADGYANGVQESTLNVLIDGKQLLPFGGLNTPAKMLGHLTDHFSPICLPGVESYYPNISTVPDNLSKRIALRNPNVLRQYSGCFSWAALGINQVVLSDLVLQYSSKLLAGQDVTKPFFVSALAEISRYYKRSTGLTGNYTPSPQTGKLENAS